MLLTKTPMIRTHLMIVAWDNWWFRVYGRGFSIEPLKGHTPLFIERTGRQRAYHFLGHCWRFLK